MSTEILKKRAHILDYLALRISRLGHGSDILFSALFTGKKENPKGELFMSLRTAGASHILALSGMHLGIIAFGFMFLFTPLFGRRASFFLTLLIILLYVFLVSSGPSLTRAVILFTLLGLFSLSGVRIDIFHILVICFLIQVIIDITSAYELSFQLSYLALGGIILGSDKVNRRIPGFIPPKLRGILAASVSAQLFTAPLVLYYFGVIYPVGVISGIILVPVITIFIWVGIVGMLPLPWVVSHFIFWIMENLFKIVEISAAFFSQFS
ncbi:MAG: ComEC/Rec2 family competence protein [Spirochaetales bacterium]|nr:ComEC/Rec2 family competence protein [Spirochaetales bacterium]